MKNLRKIRERQGLFQWQLGEMIGISQVAISAIETRESCSIETACKLADALNVSLDELCGREYHRKEFNETHAKLLNDVITKLVELEDEFYDG